MIHLRTTPSRGIAAPVMPPAIGDRSSAPRVLSERLDAAGAYVVALEGLAGQSYTFHISTPDRATPRPITVTFPAAGANADGYTATTLTFKPDAP